MTILISIWISSAILALLCGLLVQKILESKGSDYYKGFIKDYGIRAFFLLQVILGPISFCAAFSDLVKLGWVIAKDKIRRARNLRLLGKLAGKVENEEAKKTLATISELYKNL